MLDFLKSCEILLNFMKSCEILWIYEIQQIWVQNWWTSGGFQIMQISFRFTTDLLQILSADFNVDYIMDFIVDFICGFYGFHMKSTWFHMKDQEKVKNLIWISCSYWFQVDFIIDFMKSNTILLKPKWFHEISNDFMKSNWNLQRVTRFHKINRSLQDYIKSRRISWNLSGFH